MSDKLFSSDQRTFAGREDDQTSSSLAANGVGFVYKDETAGVTREAMEVLATETLTALRTAAERFDSERLLAALPEGEDS